MISKCLFNVILAVMTVEQMKPWRAVFPQNWSFFISNIDACICEQLEVRTNNVSCTTLSFTIIKNHSLWAFLPTLLFKLCGDGNMMTLSCPSSPPQFFSRMDTRMGSEILCLTPGVLGLCLQAKELGSINIDLNLFNCLYHSHVIQLTTCP